MSKKQTKSQSKNQQPQIVDQQTDPMLRALQKKVRNINKKLNEITELAARKDLKPEQEEKINKKAQVLQEREKYQEMIQIYKQIAAENIKIIRKTQLSELEDLALIIVAREYGAELTANFNESADNLVKTLTNPSRELTIQERVAQITEALIKNANNEKLKAVVKKYVESNAQKKIGQENLSNEPQSISPHGEAEVKELAQQDRKDIEQKVEAQEPLTVEGLTASRTKENNTEANAIVEVQKTEAQQAASEPKNEQSNQPSLTNNDENSAVAPHDLNAPSQQTRNERNLRGDGRGGRGGRGRGRGGRHYEDRTNKPYNKPTFKPKYKQKNPRQVQDDSDESESPEPKARDFKREEVKDLINDGFIVVGKPKPKARDQKQFHDLEHGRKFHAHNQKKNY